MIGHRRASDVSFSGTENHAAIGFGGALQIPGVVEFSLCLFFSKLVSYTFLYWLPNYIEHSSKQKIEIHNLISNEKQKNLLFVSL